MAKTREVLKRIAKDAVAVIIVLAIFIIMVYSFCTAVSKWSSVRQPTGVTVSGFDDGDDHSEFYP